MSSEVGEFLEHYGKKGMKWGTRTKKPATVREAPSADSAAATGVNTRVKSQKSTKMLSNKELQNTITRMNLEQQYSRITNNLDKTKRQKASLFVRNLIVNSGKQQLQQTVNTQSRNAVESAMAKGAAKGAAKAKEGASA